MDLLSDVLSHINLKGTLYFRAAMTSPWGVKVPPYENVARFHFAHRGRCLVRVEQRDPPVLLEQGDLIIITRGASHTLFCDPKTEDISLPLETVIEKSGFTGTGALVYGEPGTHHETQLICGHFAFDDHAKNLLIEALPRFIHIRNYGEASGLWMENTLKVIGNEAGHQKLGGDLIAIKLSEIIFVQALRAYLDDIREDVPILSGFADTHIARTLAVMHQEPEKAWSLKSLSETAGMSRTAYASKFSRHMTLSPLAYLTYWRMQIARRKLVETQDPIIQIAESVGYGSEASFSRVFKKHHNSAPATYRRLAQ
ncbi:MAG: AraC family transcriptional regulator [Pseudomonadota bacterium]